MRHNIVNIERYRTEGKSLPRVKLLADLEPELVLEWVENGVIYRQGWEGSMIDGIPCRGNHANHLPILFDDFDQPVWIPVSYLERI